MKEEDLRHHLGVNVSKVNTQKRRGNLTDLVESVQTEDPHDPLDLEDLHGHDLIEVGVEEPSI